MSATRTGIEWTDATWNPTRGCSRVSEGCRHCYAETLAARFSGPGLAYDGLVKNGKWTGEVRLIESALDQPLRWKLPRRIFVNSMSDLFHERLDPLDIGRVFNVMGRASRHTFQILTKRPERMRQVVATYCKVMGLAPLPNVWLGVSVEDQATADERIVPLLNTPAALRFVSYEPALGPVDFCHLFYPKRPQVGEPAGTCIDALRGTFDALTHSGNGGPRLNWVIIGGESGPGARSLYLGWARNAVAQCRSAGVAPFVKQLGALPRDIRVSPSDRVGELDFVDAPINLRDRKGGDMSEWPEGLRVREFPV